MITTVPVRECAKRYVEGDSLQEIARDTFHHPTTIRAALIKAGIPMRKRGPREARTLKLEVRVTNWLGMPIGSAQVVDMNDSPSHTTSHPNSPNFSVRDKIYVSIRKVGS